MKISLLFFLIPFFVFSAPTFRTVQKFPDLGIQFRVLGNRARQDPLPQARTYSYRFTRGEEEWTRDLFDPFELWYASQHAAQWRDEDRNRLIVAEVTALQPEVSAVVDEHVDQKDFQEAFPAAVKAFDPDDSAMLRAWVSAFAKSSVKEPLVLKPPYGVSQILRFPVDDPLLSIYLVRMKQRQASGSMGRSGWFCFLLSSEDGANPASIRRSIESQLLPSISLLPKRALRAGNRAGNELKVFQPGAVSPEQIVSDPKRDAAKQSIQNLKDWWYAETKEYIFLSNMRSSFGKKLIRELRETMPLYCQLNERLLPPFERKRETHVVRIFNSAPEYKSHVGAEIEWSAGAWIPQLRELALYASPDRPDEALFILRHEGFHQYLFHAADKTENVMWFNEGHACFLEGFEVKRGRAIVNESERLRHLLENLERVSMLIPRILQADRDAFYGSIRNRSLHYTAAWGLVYFLRKGTVSSRKYAGYKPILGRYWQELKASRSWENATRAAFQGVDMETFCEDFKAFWKNGRGAAKRASPLFLSATPNE